MMKYLKMFTMLFAAFVITTSLNVFAQTRGDGIIEPGEDEIAELARAAQNPVASMISLPFQSNTDFNFGPLEKTQSVLNIQPVIPFELDDNYNLADGWFLTSSPIITANWEAPDSQQWTVPMGIGVGKIFRIGKQPINANIHYYYNVKILNNYHKSANYRLVLHREGILRNLNVFFVNKRSFAYKTFKVNGSFSPGTT